MRAVSSPIVSTSGSSAGRSPPGMCSAVLRWNASAVHDGSAAPQALTAPRTWLMRNVLVRTSASRARTTARLCWLCSLLLLRSVSI